MISYLAAGVLVLALLNQVACDPRKLSSCSAQLDDGSIVDLISLDNAGTPRYASTPDFQFLFNPCSPLSCGQFSDAGICQVVNFDKTNFDLGDQSSMSVSLDSNKTLMFTYVANTPTPRSSNIQCVCAPGESFRFVAESPLRNYMFIFQSPCCCPNGCSSQAPPKKLSACSAQLSDGSIIDLSSLDDPNNPRRTSMSTPELYNFTYNPCSPLSCGSYQASGICQYNPDLQKSFDLGDQNTASFSLNFNSNLVMSFNSATESLKRNTQIECVCSPKEDFTFLGENPQLYYNFVFSSPCCCPGGCQPKPKPKKLSSCSAQLPDGSIIDLSSLDDPANPRKVTVPSSNNYTYLYNPCSALQCSYFTNAAVCQYSPLQSTDYNLGNQDTVDFQFGSGNKNLVMTLHSDYQTVPRSSEIECVCDKDEKFTFVSESPTTHYNFQFASPCCCPNGCKGGGGVTRLGPCTAQLSNGSIIDLSSLDQAKNPRESDMGDYKYFFNPCSPIACNSDTDDAAFCQDSSDGQTSFDLGDQKSSTFRFSEDDDFLKIQYKSSYRTSNLLCVCADTELFTFVNEYPALNYTFVFYSPCCCAGGCSSTPKPEVPKKIGACKAQYSDGSIIDLSAVDKMAPLQANSRDYTFIYKPCTPITLPTNCITGSSTAVCQYNDQSTFDCGDLDVKYDLDTDNTLLMVYQSSNRVSKIRCVCDKFLSFNFIQENPLKNYLFELRSECCCKNGCSSSSPQKDAVIDLLDV